jgi:non-ribosomal peptide synthetase component F
MQINILEYGGRDGIERFADKISMIDQERSFSFQEMETYAQRCATLLIRCADVIREPIAVYLPKSTETIFADLGIVYSGNAYMNFDVKSPPQRIKSIIDHIGQRLIVTSWGLARQLQNLGVASGRLFFIEDIFAGEIECDRTELWRRLDRIIDTDPLCVINTSGSTGIPKGVALNHRSTIDFMDWCFDRLGLDGSERIGSLSPFFGDHRQRMLHLHSLR